MNDERRFASDVELRVVKDEKGSKLVGYAAVFGKRSVDLGGFTEEVAPGAFTKTIREQDVLALVDHDPSRVIGRRSAGTLTLSEDKTGLRMEVSLPDTTAGRDIAESIGRGDVAGASFGFRTINDEWKTTDGKDHRTLKEVMLRDVGPVTFPAYPDTSVAIRALEDRKKQDGKSRLAFLFKKQRQIEAVR